MKRHHLKQYLTLILTLILAVQGLLTSAVQLRPVIAADDTHNLAAKLGGRSILNNTSVSFTDKDGRPVANNRVTPSTDLAFATDWTIPDDVALVAGDYYEFQLPEQMAHKGIAVDGLAITNEADVNIGNCSVTDDGLVRLTFNDEAAKLEHVSGRFSHTSNGLNLDVDEPNEVKLPFNQTTSEATPIEVHTDVIPGLTKAGVQQGVSNVVKWTLDVNNQHVAMTDGYIDEQLPDSLALSSIAIVQTDVDVITGKVTPIEGSTLTEGQDFTVESVEVAGKLVKRIHLIGSYAQTKDSFQVTVTTKLKDSDQDYNGQSIANSATLHYGNQDIPDPPTAENWVTIHYSPHRKLHKAFVGKTEGTDNYSWVAHYNESGEKLSAGTQLIDRLDSQQSFIKPGDPGSTFWFGTGNWNGMKLELEADKALVEGKDYKVTIADKTMTIELLRDIDRPLILGYAVHVNNAYNGQRLENTISDTHYNVDFDADAVIDKAEHVQIKKTCIGAKDDDHTIDWQVDINDGRMALSENYVFTDSMSANLNGSPLAGDVMVLLDKTLKLVDVDDNNRLLEPGKDYLLEHYQPRTMFKLTLLKATNHRLKLTYTSQYDATKDKQTIYENRFANGFGDHGEDRYRPSSNDVKYGNWHAKGNFFEWHVMVNTSHKSMTNASLQDPIQSTQILKSIEDVEIYAQDPATGKYTVKVDDLKAAGIYLDFIEWDNSVEVEFADGDTNSYDVVIKTVPADPTKYVGIDNTATFTNGGEPETLPGNTLWPIIAGHLIDKTGQVDQKNTAYVNWQLKVNWAAAHLEDVTVKDVASANQVIDLAALKIYPATFVDTTYNDGATAIDYDHPLKLDSDYQLKKVIDGHTGETTTAIHFNHDLTQPYIIEYRSQINTALAADSVTNKASISGSSISEDKSTDNVVVPVTRTDVSGGGDAYTGSIEVLKHDPDKHALKGAQFTLTPADADGKPDTSQTRSPITTGDDGKCRFDNLRSGGYFIKEVKAPEGYEINPDYGGDGRKVTVTFDHESRVELLTVVDQPEDTAVLPHTGGWQAGAILIVGMLTLLLSGIGIRRQTGKEAD